MASSKVSNAARMAFEESMSLAKERVRGKDFEVAWAALERAHVLGQPDGRLHLRSHWWMFRCGLAERDGREVLGQAVRVVLSLPSSWLGRYPVGNTGRARVGLFRPMPVAPDVQAILSSHQV